MWADTVRSFVDAAERGRSRKVDTVTDRVRKVGGLLPFGSGDEKTGAPGTYRPVGDTCPDTCPHLQSGACYAMYGRVELQQRRSSTDVQKAVRTALAAIVAAYASGTAAARLHVSGDFGKTDEDVDTYCRELLRAVAAYRRVTGDERVTLAWSYTHHPRMRRWVGLLRRAGISVRYSDVLGRNGAVVYPHDRIAELRAQTDRPVAKCPAQLRDVSCAECGLCWTRPDVVIAFDPHGTGKGKVEV